MSNKTLHVISFDTPYPPNYGGIVDVYYKLRSLKKQGCSIILHSFYKEEKDISRLKELCTEVHLYKRKKFNIFNFLPYIVSSRMSIRLIQNLKKDKHPILIEGIHCTGFLLRMFKRDRKIALRTHNIEHEYYNELAQYANSFLTKLYYKIEARRLERYEKRIASKIDFVFSLSQKDQLHFKDIFRNSKVKYISAFYNNEVKVTPPINYILIQGNFDVEENKEATRYMLDQIIPKCPNQIFIFAGKNASNQVKSGLKNIKIINSPSKRQMYELNNEARACVVYSNLNAGVKLKILNSLAAGVPVFCNKSLSLDAHLKQNVEQYANDKELIALIEKADRGTSTREDRQRNFLAVFNLDHNAQTIVSELCV